MQERHDGPAPRDEQKLTGATMRQHGRRAGRASAGRCSARWPLGSPAGRRSASRRSSAADRRPDQEPAQAQRPDVPPPASTPRSTAASRIRAGPRGRHADPPRGGQRRRPDDRLPGDLRRATIRRRDQRARRLADAADPPADEDAQKCAHGPTPADQASRYDMWGNFVAYSKICTHAGCPASLYEQQTNRLLCPCHQSQFQITDNARPIFGPASRRAAELPIEVDDDGYFVREVRLHRYRSAPASGSGHEAAQDSTCKALPGKTAERDRRPASRSPPRCGGCSTRSSRTTGRSCWARSRSTRSSSCC